MWLDYFFQHFDFFCNYFFFFVDLFFNVIVIICAKKKWLLDWANGIYGTGVIYPIHHSLSLVMFYVIFFKWNALALLFWKILKWKYMMIFRCNGFIIYSNVTPCGSWYIKKNLVHNLRYSLCGTIGLCSINFSTTSSISSSC